MKKLLSILGAITICTSSISVVGCTYKNLTKELIRNKINNLMGVSSAMLRGAMIQNANQESIGENEYPYDAEFLKKLTSEQLANEQIDNMNIKKGITIYDLEKDYFNDQNLSINSINKLQQNSGEYNNNKNFLSTKVFSPVPNKNIDDIFSIIKIFLSVIKVENGFSPKIANLLEGIVNKLPFNIDTAKQVSPEKLKTVKKILTENNNLLANILNILMETNTLNSIFSNVISVEFLNNVKNGNIAKILKTIIKIFNDIDKSKVDLNNLSRLINEFLKKDEIKDLTNKMVANAVVKRTVRILNTLNGDKDIFKNKDELYNSYSSNEWKIKDGKKENPKSPINIFDKFLKKIKNKEKLNFIGLLDIVDDIFYVLFGIIHRISLFDFSKEKAPESNKNLFMQIKLENEKEPDKINSVFIEEIGDIKFTNDKKNILEIAIKNIILAIDTKDNKNKNGLQLTRLLALMFHPGGYKTTNIELPNNTNKFDTIGIANILISFIRFNELDNEGFSSLLKMLGGGIAKFLNIEINNVPVLKKIDAVDIGNAFKALLINLIQGSSILNINELIEGINELLKKKLINFQFSENAKKYFKNMWIAIWDKNSSMIKEVVKSKENISLETILATKIYEEKTIADLLKLIFYSNQGFYITKTRNKYQQNDDVDKLKKALEEVGNSLYNAEFKLYKENIKGEDEEYDPLETNDKKYTALQVLMIINNNKDIFVEHNNVKYSKLKGNKAIMFALGAIYNENEIIDCEKFRENSLFSGFEKLLGNEIIKTFMNNLSSAIDNYSNTKKQMINNEYIKLIQKENFKNKVVSYKNVLLEKNEEAKIVYNTTYTCPKTKKRFTYQIQLKFSKNIDKYWQIYSIKRI